MTPAASRSPALARNQRWAAQAISVLGATSTGFSAPAIQLSNQLHETRNHAQSSAWGQNAARSATLRDRFETLAARWKRDTRFTSSTTEIVMHPAYQAIIGMGPDALALILGALQHEEDHWFWALKAISQHDPVLPEFRGSVPKMREAWLRWGRQRGLLPS
jgi:hypothetical protein